MFIDIISDLIGGFIPATLISRLLYKFLKIENKNKRAFASFFISLLLILGITRLTGMPITNVLSSYFPWLLVWFVRDLVKKETVVTKDTPVSE
jgi:hypothetical protein